MHVERMRVCNVFPPGTMATGKCAVSAHPFARSPNDSPGSCTRPRGLPVGTLLTVGTNTARFCRYPAICEVRKTNVDMPLYLQRHSQLFQDISGLECVSDDENGGSRQ